MKKLLILFLLLSISPVYAQFTQEWVNRYGDTSSTSWYSSSIKKDSLGNIYTLSESADDMGFIKYDQNGNLLLVATHWPGGYYGGGNFFDVTPSGDVYITGNVNIELDIWIYTVKFNTMGTFQWGRFYDLDRHDESFDIKVDKAGNIIIAGSALVGNNGFALTLKYNSNGDTLWTRHFNAGESNAGINKITLDELNNIYEVGNTVYPGKCLIIKYISDGSLNWYTKFTFDSLSSTSGNGIALDVNGNIYIAGTTLVQGDVINFLLKASNGGVVQWPRLFTGYSNGGYMAGPVVSSDGNSIYYITMKENGTGGGGYALATIKYNSLGDSQWVKMFNGGGVPGTANFPGNINLDKYGNIYVCGSGYFQTTGSDFVTVKYTPTGIQQWVATYTGLFTNGGDGANDILIDTSLNVYVTGNSKKQTNNGYVAVTIKYNQPLGILPNNNQLPEEFMLYQNYPNPFNPVTIISYQLPKTSEVKLSIYNILGAEVKTLVNCKQEAGTYSIALNMDNYASGIYFYILKAGNDFIETKKLILIK